MGTRTDALCQDAELMEVVGLTNSMKAVEMTEIIFLSLSADPPCLEGLKNS